MKFTLTVSTKWNYTPSDLMRTFAKNSARYDYTYDYYFTSVLLDRQTNTYYYYDHLERTKLNYHTETVTVFLTEKKNDSDLPDFNSPEAFFCEPD